MAETFEQAANTENLEIDFDAIFPANFELEISQKSKMLANSYMATTSKTDFVATGQQL